MEIQLQTEKAGIISLDPFSQASINSAKQLAPGAGIGPAVATVLVAQIANGKITRAEQLPQEYRLLASGFEFQ